MKLGSWAKCVYDLSLLPASFVAVPDLGAGLIRALNSLSPCKVQRAQVWSPHLVSPTIRSDHQGQLAHSQWPWAETSAPSHQLRTTCPFGGPEPGKTPKGIRALLCCREPGV